MTRPACGAWRIRTQEHCTWPVTCWLGPVPLCKQHYEAARVSRTESAKFDSAIYFARTGDYIKIGRSRNVDKRVRHLHADRGILRPDDLPPGPLTLLYAVPAWSGHEAVIHEAFASARAVGEWFYATPDLLAYIDSLVNTPDGSLSAFPQPGDQVAS